MLFYLLGPPNFIFFFFSVRMLATEELSSAFKWWDKYCHSLSYIYFLCLAVTFVVS